MWRKAFLLVPLLCGSIQASPLKNHATYDFSKGLDTYHSSLSLPDGFVHDALNVFFDSKAPISKRQGFVVSFSTKAYSFNNLWSYTDSTNTSWIIVRSSDQLTAANLAGSIVRIATVSVNNVVGEANAFGNAFFVDQTQGVYYWNGSSTSFVSGSPMGSIITSFHNRLWVLGAAVPNGNQLYGSAYYSGNTWGTGPNPNDPVQLSIGLQDNFDNATAEYVYLDTLYLFKHYATYALYGFDQTNFQISQLTQECGCIDGGSIQTFGGSLKFASLRGMENFDGYNCTRISDPVKDKVDASIQAIGFSEQSWLQSLTSDWNAGTLSQVSTTISPPALVISTGVAIDSTTSSFNAGTYNSTSLSGNSVVLSLNNTQLLNNSFESGQSTNWTANGLWANVSLVNGLGAFDGTQYETRTGAASVTARILDCNSFSTLASNTYSPGLTSWLQGAISGVGLSGRCVRVQFDVAGDTLTSDSFFSNGRDVQFYYSETQHLGVNTMGVDFVSSNPRSSISSGTFTSKTFDTGVSSSVIQVNISSTSNTEAINFVLRHSTASTGPFVDLTTSLGANVTSNRFVQYIATFTTTSTDTVNSSLNSVTLQWAASTGTFQTPIHGLGAVNSWGNFPVTDQLNGGNIAFSICSSTNSNMGSPTSCSVQTPNSQITIATGTFVQWFATFTVTAATQTPTLNSAAVQWFTGNKSAPMASTVWDNRYLLSLTTNTADSFNDAILVLSTKGSWSVLDIKAGGLTQSKGSLYHSDSTATGNVYLDNQGYNDNGNPINAFIQTKDYCEEGPSQEDYYESIYPSMDNLGNYNMNISYEMDRNPTVYSLSSVNQTEFSANTAIKIPFVLNTSNQNFGKCINFTFSEPDLNSPWNFYGFTSYFHEREVQ